MDPTTINLWSRGQELWPLDHRGGPRMQKQSHFHGYISLEEKLTTSRCVNFAPFHNSRQLWSTVTRYRLLIIRFSDITAWRGRTFMYSMTEYKENFLNIYKNKNKYVCMCFKCLYVCVSCIFCVFLYFLFLGFCNVHVIILYSLPPGISPIAVNNNNNNNIKHACPQTDYRCWSFNGL
jgi:hypothetical protein